MRNLAFLVGSPDISGGTNVVFRHAMGLAEQGVSVTLVAPKKIGRRDVAWHPIVSAYDHPNLLWQDFSDILGRSFDLAIATWWKTYLDLWKISAAQYAYFVQSIESRFYPPAESIVRCTVDATYDLPCGFITEAWWIRDYLQRVHGHEAALAPNGIDKNIFTFAGRALAPRQPGKLRLLVEGPVDVPFKNVPAAVRLAREAGVDEIWLLTTSNIDHFPGVDRVISRIPHDQTPEVYRSCDVMLKLSLVEGMFGPPLEMFHCGGTCVVYNVSGHDEYITHGKNGLVVPMNDEGKVVTALRHLQAPGLVAALKKNALTTALAWPDWAASTSQFADGLRQITGQKTIPRDILSRYSQRISYFLDCGFRLSAPPPAPSASFSVSSPSALSALSAQPGRSFSALALMGGGLKRLATDPIFRSRIFDTFWRLVTDRKFRQQISANINRILAENQFFLARNRFSVLVVPRAFLQRTARTVLRPFRVLARGIMRIVSLLNLSLRVVWVVVADAAFRRTLLNASWQVATNPSFRRQLFEKIKQL